MALDMYHLGLLPHLILNPTLSPILTQAQDPNICLRSLLRHLANWSAR